MEGSMPNLEAYGSKRDFERTSEPKPAVSKRLPQQPRFVVQEHHASRLHFDFRVEAGGVLKSWAVPKGPSLNPAEKRLAVMTEDHPVKYLSFEGRIPAGNYGAGDMAIWDCGTYEAVDGDVEGGVRRGKIVLRLHGKKLRGEFHMVRLRGEDTQWLMFKGKDEYADPDWRLEPVFPVSLGTESKSGIASGRASGKSNRASGKSKAASTSARNGTTKVAANDSPSYSSIIGQPGAIPAKVTPMLATLADAVPAGDNYLYELKWDGFRNLNGTDFALSVS
jgi:bifunctional non-homologous end joining protein LigD